MDRRAFISMMGGSILAAPLTVEAPQAEKVYRIGWLGLGEPTRMTNKLVCESYLPKLPTVLRHNTSPPAREERVAFGRNLIELLLQ